MKKDWMVRESELDDDQIRVLTATLDKSCIVTGCAGSGKSVLGLIKAQRIQKERGNNYKIIVFTRALCKYMDAGKKELGIKNDFYYLKQWKEKGCPSADYVIVDEIQDFTDEEIEAFLNATKKNFFFFGDTAQSIYDGLKKTVEVEQISRLFPKAFSAKAFELYRNYRLPVPVAKFACQVGVGTEYVEGVYKSSETGLPYLIEYESDDEELVAICDIIGKQNLTDVAILLPTNEQVREVYQKLRQIGGNYEARYSIDRFNYGDNLNFNSQNPKIMTYHSAKGLQFETVFMPYLGKITRESRKQLYVAMTRTYRDLYMMYNGSLPEALSKIDKTLYKSSEVEQIEDL